MEQLAAKRARSPAGFASKLHLAKAGGKPAAAAGHRTLLVSATLSTGVARLAALALHDPIRAGFASGVDPAAGGVEQSAGAAAMQVTSYGLQLQPLWRIPAAAVGDVMAYSCNPCGKSLLQL